MSSFLLEAWACVVGALAGAYAMDIIRPAWDDAAEAHAAWVWRDADPFEYDGPCMAEEDLRSRRRALAQHARSVEPRTHVVTDHPGVYAGYGLKIRDFPHRYPTRGHSHVLMSLEPGEEMNVHRTLYVCESEDRLAQMAFVSNDRGTEGWSVMRVETLDWEGGEWVDVWARYLEEGG